MTYCEKIFSTIKEKGLKQSDLARLLDVSTGQITMWKQRNKTPPAEYLPQICEFLGISILDLFDIPYQKSEVEILYSRLSKDDKAVVDLILNKYKDSADDNDTKSSNLKIG